ncbi:hypothetical protein IQ269_09070 [Tychonema sp. LEGE 07199]|uniref:hypothetical protein n=1 Tax=unclassified Tychonema TaxID=2642144 RepID=UPI001881E1B4|nr:MULTISPECIES: hypothetical protein [unclassified Tychonema]MBE9120965.1 hypothetical protein [Tychonema sp. LEGE 07199]MBE9131094.1 hypothetical protein [Tychonema sp. LEGE 07196]
MEIFDFKLRRKFLIDGLFLFLVVLVTVGVTSIYVSTERTFYWWDYAGYNTATVNTANLFRDSPDRAWRGVIESLSKEKNLSVALPLLPFILLFGDSRLSYILSVSLIYVLPFRLLLGAISAQLIPVYPRRVFWSTVLLSLLIPMSWIPTLRGYLDTGGCVFVGLAIWIYLQDARLKSWWKVPLIGFFLGTAILFRRHFAYSAIAFLGAASLQAFFEFFVLKYRNKTALKYRFLLEPGIKLGLIAATILTFLMLVAGDFTRSALTVNYGNLYVAWSLPVNDILIRYGSFYGLGTWLLVLIGFSAGILRRILVPGAAVFVCLFGVLSLVEWLLILRYGYLHYTIHVTPIALLGISTFFWTIWLTLKGKVRYLMLGAAGFYLIVNAAVGLIPVKVDLSRLFVSNFGPLVRSDYGEVVKLVEFLRKLAPDEEPIYIAGASNSFNANILRQANRKLNPPEGWWKLNTIGRPQIDSRDSYPLPELLQAQYAAVAVPFQQVLPTDEQVLRSHEQDVVKVVWDAFTQNWEISRDFQLLPQQFKLENGVTVSIYRRIRPTDAATAVRTLYAMQQQIVDRPGGQLDWISLRQSIYTSANYSVSRESDNLYKIVTHPIKNSTKLDTSFLYLGAISDRAQVTGKLTLLNQQCPGVALRLTLWDKQGKLIDSAKMEYGAKSAIDLNLLVEGKNPTYLMLEVLSSDKQELTKQCQLEINNLSVSSKPK